MSKKALITGIAGQDGSYLAELLLEKNYEVHGLIRRTAGFPESLNNIEGIKNKLILHFGDLAQESHLCALVNELKPDEIYNLAAQSDVGISFEIPEYTGNITGLGVTRLLEAIRKFSPNSKLAQASSSEMFGSAAPPQNENGPFNPQNPYAVAKLYAFHMCKIYRKAYKIFICNSICFNHESPRRGINFVTRKITKGIADIVKGKSDFISLGNLDSKRDWGYSPEYMYAQWLMLQQEKPDDFCIGTGETHTVGEFVKYAFEYVNLDWNKYIRIDPKFIRPSETNYLQADIKKAEFELGWKPKVKFHDLIKIMIDNELKS